jgi:hypothetical protein
MAKPKSKRTETSTKFKTVPCRAHMALVDDLKRLHHDKASLEREVLSLCREIDVLNNNVAVSQDTVTNLSASIERLTRRGGERGR